MIKFCLLAPLLTLSALLYGQQETDSLLKAIRKLPDTSKVNALNEAGKSYWISGEDSLSEYCLTQSIALAKSVKFHEGEARARLQLVRMELDYMSDLATAHLHLDTVMILSRKAKDRLLEGQGYFRRAQLYGSGFTEHAAKSRELLEEARKLFVETGNKAWEGSVYVELAEKASNEGKYAEAIDLLLKARKLQEESGEITALRATLPNLGSTYLYLEMFDEALKCFEDAEKTANQLKDERVKAFIYSQRSTLYKKKKQFTQALKDLKAANKIYEATGGGYLLPGSYTRLGEVYFEMDSISKAFNYAVKADSLYRSDMDAEELFHHPSNVLLGKIYLKRNQFQKVITSATQGKQEAESSDPKLIAELTEYHRQLALAREGLHQYKDALFHYKTYKTLSDSLFNTESRERSKIAALTYDFDKQQQSDRLRIQELENQKLKNTRNILIALSVLVSLIILYITWSNKQLRRKNKQIIAKNREIEKALDKGQRMERKRVASELHDNLNTKLAAIRWNIQSMDTSGFDAFNQKIHSRISEMVDDAYKDVRLISHNMLPTELETHGLTEALNVLVHKLGDNNGMRFKLELEGNIERLSKEQEHQLYNIALELVNNAIKHSEATLVTINLTRDREGLSLSVTDNGIGIPAGLKNNGRGFHNLMSRTETLKGTFKMESPPGGGTRAEVHVPQRV